MRYILGFDLGTSSCKAALYDERLALVCTAGREYPTFFPNPGWAEQPAGQWWDAFCDTVPRCLTQAGAKPGDVACVAIDSMGSAALPVDRDGTALHPGLLWMDRRAHSHCQEMAQALGGRLFDITGNRADPSDIAPKLLWFQRERPEVYERTHKFLHANGYLVQRLTGEFTQDRTEGGLTLLYDIRENRWSDELFRTLGLDRGKLPEIFDCQEIVGAVTGPAAQACGLAPGTPVIAGAMDVVASGLGTGCVHPGDVYITGGTVTAVGIVAQGPNAHPSLHLHNHIVPGRYIQVSAVDFGGGGLRWFRDILREESYGELDRIAALLPPGNDGLLFLPYMVGQRSPLYNSNTSGVVFGLAPEHGRAHLARMFMEGTSYAVCKILDYFLLAGSPPRQARITGGLSKSAVWTQILCDILDLPIDLPRASDVATLGVAASAAVALGWYGDYGEALGGRAPARSFCPAPENRAVYDRMYDVYERLFETVLPLYDYAKEHLSPEVEKEENL